ncbi:hypothetical protein NG99_08950 [Erwinia typographi]|uniref:Uncharacterized protein n=2 Tax=Erwinia typographi TaxID=371042 RepID=A0A0A3Z5A9_9GAMM|nr:hypothetical protein NG99_08950 [Erwinia typographi]
MSKFSYDDFIRFSKTFSEQQSNCLDNNSIFYIIQEINLADQQYLKKLRSSSVTFDGDAESNRQMKYDDGYRSWAQQSIRSIPFYAELHKQRTNSLSLGLSIVSAAIPIARNFYKGNPINLISPVIASAVTNKIFDTVKSLNVYSISELNILTILLNKLSGFKIDLINLFESFSQSLDKNNAWPSNGTKTLTKNQFLDVLSNQGLQYRAHEISSEFMEWVNKSLSSPHKIMFSDQESSIFISGGDVLFVEPGVNIKKSQQIKSILNAIDNYS